MLNTSFDLLNSNAAFLTQDASTSTGTLNFGDSSSFKTFPESFEQMLQRETEAKNAVRTQSQEKAEEPRVTEEYKESTAEETDYKAVKKEVGMEVASNTAKEDVNMKIDTEEDAVFNDNEIAITEALLNRNYADFASDVEAEISDTPPLDFFELPEPTITQHTKQKSASLDNGEDAQNEKIDGFHIPNFNPKENSGTPDVLDGVKKEVKEKSKTEESSSISFDDKSSLSKEELTVVQNPIQNAKLAQAEKKGAQKKIEINVQDMRVENKNRIDAVNNESANFVRVEASADISESILEVNIKNSAGNSFQNVFAEKQGAHLENLLARELHNGLNGDIVRQAQIVLRDGGQGLIKMQLHPETLGNVHIKLQLSGGKIEGLITVESMDALRAFEKELASLENTFLESGFEGASLDMRFAGGNNNRDDGMEEMAQIFDFVSAMAASEATENYDTLSYETEREGLYLLV